MKPNALLIASLAGVFALLLSPAARAQTDTVRVVQDQRRLDKQAGKANQDRLDTDARQLDAQLKDAYDLQKDNKAKAKAAGRAEDNAADAAKQSKRAYKAEQNAQKARSRADKQARKAEKATNKIERY